MTLIIRSQEATDAVLRDVMDDGSTQARERRRIGLVLVVVWTAVSAAGFLLIDETGLSWVPMVLGAALLPVFGKLVLRRRGHVVGLRQWRW